MLRRDGGSLAKGTVKGRDIPTEPTISRPCSDMCKLPKSRRLAAALGHLAVERLSGCPHVAICASPEILVEMLLCPVPAVLGNYIPQAFEPLPAGASAHRRLYSVPRLGLDLQCFPICRLLRPQTLLGGD